MSTDGNLDDTDPAIRQNIDYMLGALRASARAAAKESRDIRDILREHIAADTAYHVAIKEEQLAFSDALRTDHKSLSDRVKALELGWARIAGIGLGVAFAYGAGSKLFDAALKFITG